MSEEERRVMLRALLAAAAVVVLYVTFRLTATGAHLDERVRTVVKHAGASAKPLALGLLGVITPASLVVAVLVLSVVAWRTRGQRAALWLAVEIATVVTVSQALKAVLPRASWRTADVTLGGGSFPSGHATIAAALTLALVAALPARWRAAAKVFALPVVAAFALATVIAGWHRPSDAVAGVLLALAAHLVWLAASREGVERRPSERPKDRMTARH